MLRENACTKEEEMPRNIWKVASLPIVAIVAIIFALGRNTSTNLPPGTYWNLNAGFGDSELKLFEDGHYTNGGIGAVSVEGNYSLKQDQIMFTEYGPADAPCRYMPGTYKWNWDGQVLTLKALDDTCATRQVDWASGQWFKHPSAKPPQ
jgi:hypothetical protein